MFMSMKTKLNPSATASEQILNPLFKFENNIKSLVSNKLIAKSQLRLIN